MAELVILLIDGIHALIEIGKLLGEDPRIAMALAILMIAGWFVASLIRKTRRDEFLNLDLNK